MECAFNQSDTSSGSKRYFFFYIMNPAGKLQISKIRFNHFFAIIYCQIKVRNSIHAKLIYNSYNDGNVTDWYQWLWQYFRKWIQSCTLSTCHNNDWYCFKQTAFFIRYADFFPRMKYNLNNLSFFI